MKPSRREFLIASAALPLACHDTAKPKAPPEDPRFANLAYFVPTEARVMDAWLEQLLPGGTPPGTPGARDAHVLAYVDKQLALPHFAHVAKGVRRAGVILQRAAQD